MNIDTLKALIAKLPPPPDEIEIRVRDADQLPAEFVRRCEPMGIGKGIPIVFDPYIPAGFAVERNLTRGTIRIIDLRDGSLTSAMEIRYEREVWGLRFEY